MSIVKATAKWEKDGEQHEGNLEVDYDFGEDMNAMAAELGPDVVFRHAISSITVALQGQMRQWIAQGLSEDEIKAPGGKLDEWSPPSGKPRSANRMAKIEEMLKKMSPEEREAVLALASD